jgi:antitoxin (DNA-binding transcriptional repressor) of toxin-antitoxin stability system
LIAYLRKKTLMRVGDFGCAFLRQKTSTRFPQIGKVSGWLILYTLVYFIPMKLSISEARKRLPELVRQVRKDAGARVEITVRDEVVAELRATLPEPEPGAAAKKLVQLMRRLPKYRGRKMKVSEHVKEHLYGSRAKSR